MSHTATVQTIYQLFGKGDIPAILELMSDKVNWEQNAMDHGVPWLKPGRGKLHVHQFFKTIAREIEFTRLDIKPPIEIGNQVIAMIDLEAKVRSTGKPLNDLEFHIWTFDEEGKVRSFRHVVDTHQHFLASKR
jgi:ketosteroid isomerase-like protein